MFSVRYVDRLNKQLSIEQSDIGMIDLKYVAKVRINLLLCHKNLLTETQNHTHNFSTQPHPYCYCVKILVFFRKAFTNFNIGHNNKAKLQECYLCGHFLIYSTAYYPVFCIKSYKLNKNTPFLRRTPKLSTVYFLVRVLALRGPLSKSHSNYNEKCIQNEDSFVFVKV